MRLLLGILVVLSVCASGLAQLRGTVTARSFVDGASGRTVNFNIYLPEGYGESARRYPVVYHLHGLGGSESGPANVQVPRSFELAMDQGLIGPVIVVFPRGYEDSWWADSFSGNKPAETDVVSRLVPYVDANFRTVADRGARVVQGFSMGGFGAAKFYSKFPGLFSVCVEYDGAYLTWLVFRITFPSVASEVFGNSETYFNTYSPWTWMNTNAAVVRDGPPVRMVVGLLTPQNRSFRDYLTARTIPVDYVETGCGHDLGCLLDEQGMESAAFIGARLELGCRADFNGDGTVNSQDFFAFLSEFFLASALGDFNEDGSTNSQDFFDFLGVFFGC